MSATTSKRFHCRSIALGLLCAAIVGSVGCQRRDGDTLAEMRALHEQGDFEASIDPLRRFLDEGSREPEAHYLLGKALFRTGETSLAIWPLRRAFETPEYAVDSGRMLARILMDGRTPMDAVDTIEKVVAIEPDNVQSLEMRVQAYLRVNRQEDALDDMDRIIELDPENLGILVPRVVALIQLDRIDAAEEALIAAQHRMDTAERKVPEATRAKLCVANGLFAFEKGELEKAKTLYAECVETYPTDQVVVQQAVEFYDKIAEVERATDTLQQAFEEARSPAFRNALARRMGRMGEVDEQERLLREEAEERSTLNAWFTLGDYYVQREDYDAACDAFERALAADPTPPPNVRLAYADTLIQAGRYEEAEKATLLVEQEHLQHLLRGRIRLANGDAEGALELFSAGIRLWPNHAGARFLSGQAAERLGDFDRAIAEYRESVRANAKETEAGLFLARILADKGADGAAMVAVRRHLSGHPRDPAGYLLAIRLSRKGDHEKAVTQNLHLLAQLPGQAATALAEQTAMLAEDPEKGPQAAVDAIEFSKLDLDDPANALALRALLTQLAALGKHEEARARVAAALEAQPDAAVFHVLSARALRAAGGPVAEVRRSFERALELAPEDTGALMGLAELSVEAGSRDAAVALYDRATAADPDDAQAAHAAIELLRADGRTAEVSRRLESLLETHPRDARAANDLAKLLASDGVDLDGALAFAQRASYFVGVPEAPETLGSIYLQRGEPGLALAPLKQALAARPESTSARLRLGQAYAAQGEKASARQAFLAIIDAGAPEAAQARTEMARLNGTDGAAAAE